LDYFSSGVFDNNVFRIYLAFININTKYLVIYPMNKKEYPDSKFTLACFKDLEKSQRIKNIRGDHDPSFGDVLTNIFMIKE
jgi:hypothetical protein